MLEPTAVVVSITSGPAGAVSTHTPDVCYPAGGYKILHAPKRETIDLPGGGQATYLVADFEKVSTGAAPDRQRVRWSWSTDGHWIVPKNPRFAFVPWFSAPQGTELYKLYVVTPLVGDAPDSQAEQAAIASTFAQYSAAFSR